MPMLSRQMFPGTEHAKKDEDISLGKHLFGEVGRGLADVAISSASSLARLAVALPASLSTGGVDLDRPFVDVAEAKASDLSKDLFPVDPERSESFLTGTLPRGAGSLGGFAITGAVGRAAGLGATLASSAAGALSTAEQLYQQAKGAGATDDEAFKAFVGGAAVGSTEGLPVGKAFSRLDEVSGGAVKKLLARAAAGFLEEGTQEFFQTIGENAVAQRYIDENREVFTKAALLQAGEAALAGGILGSTMNVVLNAPSMAPEVLQNKGLQQAKTEAASEIKEATSVPRLQQQLDVLRPIVPEAGLKPVEAPPLKPNGRAPIATTQEQFAKKSWYHGTAAQGLRPDLIDASMSDERGLYGLGVYLTDDPGVARSYAKDSSARTDKAAVTYQVQVDPGRVLDLEAPAPADATQAFRSFAESLGNQFGPGTAYDEELDLDAFDAWLENNPGATPAKMYSYLRGRIGDISLNHNLAAYEFRDALDDFSFAMRKAGYEAFSHTGGQILGKGQRLHQVLILLDPMDRLGLGSRVNIQQFAPVVDKKLSPGLPDSMKATRAMTPEASQAIPNPTPDRDSAPEAVSEPSAGTLEASSGQSLGDSFQAALTRTKLRIFRQADAGSLPAQVAAKAARWFAYSGGVGSRFMQLKAKRAGELQANAAVNSAKFQENLKVLSALSPEENYQAYLMLTGETDGATLPTEVQAAIKEARQTIDGLSEQVINEVLPFSGQTEVNGQEVDVLSEMQATIKENLGKYVTRFYEADHLKNYDSYIRRHRGADFDAAVAYVMETQGVEADEAVGQVRSLLVRHADPVTGAYSDGRGGGKIPQSRFRTRKNIPEPIRRVLGEIKDPAVVIQKTVHDLELILAQHAFLSRVAANTDPSSGIPFAKDIPSAETGHIHRLDDVPSNGPLRNKWVTRETAEALADSVPHGSPGLELLDQIIGRKFRKAKTVYSPGTHARNMLGNTVFAELANTSVLNPANWKHYKRAVDALLDRAGEDFRLVAESGALGSQFFQAPGVEFALRRMGEVMERKHSVWQALKLYAGRADDKVTGLYVMEDQLFRAASFFKAMDRGKTADQAAEWTNRFFPDYDTNPRALRYFEKAAISRPFLSFFSQLPRIATNGFIHNPIKMGLVTAAVQAAIAGMPVPSWWDDEKKRAQWASMRKLLPEYAQRSVPFYEGNTLKLVNIQNIFPFSDLQELVNSENPGKAFAEQFLFGGPVVEVPLVFRTGKTTQGFELFGPEASTAERIQATANEILKAVTPPLTPGFGYEARRLELGINQNADRYGRKQDLADALIGLVSGVRPQNMSWDALHYFQTSRWIRNLEFEANKARQIRDNPTASASDKASAAETLRAEVSRFEQTVAELDQALADARKMPGATMTLPPDLAKSLAQRTKAAISGANHRIEELEGGGKKAATRSAFPRTVMFGGGR